VTRFAITLPPNEQFTGGAQPFVALSPDGTRLVYAVNRNQGPLLYLRVLDQLDAAPIRNTDGGSSPFFSADGQWIAFWRSGQLEKVSVAGGAPVVVCAAPSFPSGASWGADDTIVFGQGANEIWRVAGTGGIPEAVIKADAGQYVYGPQILPGGRAVLFTLNAGAIRSWDRAQIVVQSLDTRKRQVVMQGGHDARYLATGHLAYVTGGTLFAVPFDVATLKVTGGSVPLVENVRASNALVSGAAQFSVSRTGSLVYLPANIGERRTLVWVDRQGREEPVPAEPRPYQYPRISPDGTRLAVNAADQDNDVWIWEFARATMTRLTSTPDQEFSPLWSPDGRHVWFQSAHSGPGNVYRQAADGTGAAERLTTSPNRHLPYAFTPDGKTLVFGELDPKGQYDLRLLPMEGDHASKSLLSTPFNEQNADLSPAGRWIVYQSNQSGQDEIYVRPFPRVEDGRWQISVGGGSRPVWARSGRELFYLNPSGAMMTVEVRSQSGFSAGNPIRLFEGSYALPNVSRHFDVARDGRRFMMIKQLAGNNEAARLIVVENWFEELKARLPAR
jgi:Tol biopolymer transport system component